MLLKFYSDPYLANVPIESYGLNTNTADTETTQVIVIKKLIDWFLYE